MLPLQLDVVVDTPGDLSPYYNVTGISSDGAATTANYDGDGYSYSEQALAAAGLTPGGTFNSGGITYTCPKTVASITLPSTVNNGSIGIFAIAAG